MADAAAAAGPRRARLQELIDTEVEETTTMPTLHVELFEGRTPETDASQHAKVQMQ